MQKLLHVKWGSEVYWQSFEKIFLSVSEGIGSTLWKILQGVVPNLCKQNIYICQRFHITL
jgi:hypothetical protein